jgi:hypothetical protein
MSFNICRGTLGSLAMFIAMRNASSREGASSTRETLTQLAENNVNQHAQAA